MPRVWPLRNQASQRQSRAHRSGESTESCQNCVFTVEEVAPVNSSIVDGRSNATVGAGGVIESVRTELATCEDCICDRQRQLDDERTSVDLARSALTIARAAQQGRFVSIVFGWQQAFWATDRREQQQLPHIHDGHISATASSRFNA
jgi:protein-arginine kinase activator protein McsA